MLRAALLAVSLALLAAGALGLAAGWSVYLTLWLLWTGAILAVGIVYERVRYKPVETQRPGPGWERTAERFFDETLGKTVTVYIHPETGERRYVEE